MYDEAKEKKEQMEEFGVEVTTFREKQIFLRHRKGIKWIFLHFSERGQNGNFCTVERRYQMHLI